MKYNLLLITFSLLLVISLTVKAEDIINNNTSNKCKTMQNGVCTEYYTNTNYEANIQITPKQDMRLLNKKEKTQVCNNTFGFFHVLDPYNPRGKIFNGLLYTRIYITNVQDNSPASRTKLKVGDEILKINNIKVDKMQNADFNNYIDNFNKINFEIKDEYGNIKYITLQKANMCSAKELEPMFDSYVKQIWQNDDYMWHLGANIYCSQKVYNKLTLRTKNELNGIVLQINNWFSKREQFRNGFNLCLANNYNLNDVNNCLNQLVNRSLNQIANEQNLQMQQAALQAQQQMQQRQINALNNYSYALQNQRMQVDTNVYHSGTINNNINLNGNINGTYYHYRY